jgi:hypothetical protein
MTSEQTKAAASAAQAHVSRHHAPQQKMTQKANTPPAKTSATPAKGY